MPYIIALFMIASSSGMPLDHSFIASLKKSETKSFAKESKTYLQARLIGMSWEDGIKLLEKRAYSERYRNFLRGLSNVAKTSLRVPEYLNSFYSSYIFELEMRWREYWNRVGLLLESIMLLTLSSATVILASMFIETSLTTTLASIVSSLILLFGIIGVLMAKAMRPMDRLILARGLGPSLTSYIAWPLSLLPLSLDLELNTRIFMFSSILIIGGIYLFIETREVYRRERENIAKLQKAEQLVRAGYSVDMAFEEVGLARQTSLKKAHMDSFFNRYLGFIVRALKEFGNIRSEFVSVLYDQLERLLEIERLNKRNMALFTLIGALIPSLLAYLSIRLAHLMALGADVLYHLTLVYLCMAISTGILLSEAIDGSFLLSTRTGINCLILATTLSII